MSIELNWHEGDEHPNIVWDTAAQDLPVPKAAPAVIAQALPAKPALRLPRGRTLALLLAIPAVLLLLAGAVLLWRVNRGDELARQDIEAAAQAALVARQDGDRELLALLLDPSDPVWVEQQLALLSTPAATTWPAAIDVEKVELSGNQALATVSETQADGSRLRKLTFWRLSDDRWRLTPANQALLGEQQQTRSPHFVLTYSKVDEPFIVDLINTAEGAYVTLCGELRCRRDTLPLSLQLYYDIAATATAQIGRVLTPSPWLVGVDAAGKPAPAFTQELVRQLATQLAQAKAPEAAPTLWQAVGDWAANDLAGATLPAAPETPGADLFAAHIQAGRLPLPLDIVWSEVALEGNEDNALAQAQMVRLLAFVQASYGSDAVGQLLEGAPRHLHEIVRRRFAVDLQTFEQAWLQWLGTFPMLTP